MKEINRLDRIDQLIDAGFDASIILDEMTMWFSDKHINEFVDDFVRVHEVTFGKEWDAE